jgi:hypothetical protein
MRSLSPVIHYRSSLTVPALLHTLTAPTESGQASSTSSGSSPQRVSTSELRIDELSTFGLLIRISSITIPDEGYKVNLSLHTRGFIERLQ